MPPARYLIVLLSVSVCSLALATTALAERPEFLPLHNGELFSAKSGKLTFQAKGGAAITCKSSEVLKGEGELLGPKTASFNATLGTNCTAGGLPVKSMGDASGTILMHVALERLCYVNKAAKEVGALLTISPVHLEVPATKLSIEVSGSLVAALTPTNLETVEYKVGLAQKEGKQSIEKCEGEAADTLSTVTDGGAAAQTGLEASEFAIVFDKAQELVA